MKKTLLMIQPGAFGDIFVCAPIAKFYHEIGYEIYWPTAERFRSTIEKFPYVNHVILGDDERDSDWLKSDVLKCLDIQKILDPDIVLNLADRGPHTTAERPGETYEQPKYRLAGVSSTDSRGREALVMKELLPCSPLKKWIARIIYSSTEQVHLETKLTCRPYRLVERKL